ncbi:hypothetical protein SEA_COEUR_25 [Gordonia phage Coeur]|uniref:Uncharacterized protein n=1 Tax=Gordonia phage Coeur TaxID=2571246 RepID=A0A4Y6EG17_9CAUD|nr:hypothetical protein PQC60_gp25 [Gordonia phage Coeur]QDF17442.1 hypothetical protein SEA_COEUR_25 [Gordonia phage Coeur]
MRAGHRWRVRRLRSPRITAPPWVVERLHWDRWHAVANYSTHREAIRCADTLARRGWP